MEAGLARNPPVLKGVFERLYSDATQRIQRQTGPGKMAVEAVVLMCCSFAGTA